MRLLLPALLLPLFACDDPLLERGADAEVDASGAWSIADPLSDASALDDHDGLETIDGPKLAGSPASPGLLARLAEAPTVASFTGSPTSARARVLGLVQPALALVPGLAESLAAGALARPTEDLALPGGVAALTGAPWLVIDGRLAIAHMNAVEPAWSTGVPRLVTRPGPSADDGGLFVARKTLVPDALPSAHRALVGATVKLFDHEREVCVARVAGLELEARLIHNPADWGFDDEADRPSPPDHDATSVFELGVPMLLARLDPVSGTADDCARGLWAAPVESPTPTLFARAPMEKMDKSLSRLAVRAFRALPTWRERQHDFVTFYGDDPSEPRPTTRWDANATHDMVRFLSRDGAREVLAVTANTWDGCGSSGQHLTALFDVVRDGGRARLVPIASHAWSDIPAGLVDLEADGRLELLGDGVVYRWHDDRAPASPDNGYADERYEEVRRLTVPDITMYGCGC
ncbi:MAG: hypothetical protein IT385_17290 [Deltaproteobacteria bacterium]|nr:hypothetical protein [Deltaproteobacteria bacterium]